MIRALAWFGPEHYGVIVPGGRSWQAPSPAPSATAEILAIIDRPVKYFGRTTTESRHGLCAASVALRAVPRREPEPREIGLISSSLDGCLRDNREYFRDYVECGRTLGRGNLFIYTLPTSVAGEIAIALELTGPSMFIHDDHRPLESLARHAERLVTNGEADRMLALWSTPHATLCMVVDPGENGHALLATLAASKSASQLFGELQRMVEQS